MASVSARIAVAAGLALTFAAGASADVIATFGFTDLNGSYTQTSPLSGQFHAQADDTVLHTGGDVTRNAAPGGTATFDTGFLGLGTMANVVVDLSVTITGANEATGSGTLTVTDVDGDTLTADISGMWQSPGFGVVFFSGLMNNVFFNDNGAADGTFNGTSGAFDMDLPGSAPYIGAFSQLYIRFGAGFFTGNFANQTVSVDGQIVPAPGALALAGVAGLIARRRRA